MQTDYEETTKAKQLKSYHQVMHIAQLKILCKDRVPKTKP